MFGNTRMAGLAWRSSRARGWSLGGGRDAADRGLFYVRSEIGAALLVVVWEPNLCERLTHQMSKKAFRSLADWNQVLPSVTGVSCEFQGIRQGAYPSCGGLIATSAPQRIFWVSRTRPTQSVAWPIVRCVTCVGCKATFARDGRSVLSILQDGLCPQRTPHNHFNYWVCHVSLFSCFFFLDICFFFFLGGGGYQVWGCHSGERSAICYNTPLFFKRIASTTTRWSHAGSCASTAFWESTARRLGRVALDDESASRNRKV